MVILDLALRWDQRHHEEAQEAGDQANEAEVLVLGEVLGCNVEVLFIDPYSYHWRDNVRSQIGGASKEGEDGSLDFDWSDLGKKG